MTAAELIHKATKVVEPFTSASIPLKLEGKDLDIDFDVAGNNENGYVVNMIIKQ